jgi:hypothetical protein
MSTAPIAALLARDAVEQQFREEEQFRADAPVRPTRRRGRVRLAAARALRRLADLLEPRPPLTPESARRASPAAHRGSPC